jgi:hypothetical protein
VPSTITAARLCSALPSKGGAAVISVEKSDRDEAIERAGRALYGELWIEELGAREWKIAKDNSANHRPTVAVDLPSSGKEAAKIARARFRFRASDEQIAQVICWLNDARVFDGSVSEFDAWFRKQFPDAPLSSTEKRKAAVLALLKSGLRPGRGGNITRPKFYDEVLKQSGQLCDEKTIRRDAEEISRAELDI